MGSVESSTRIKFRTQLLAIEVVPLESKTHKVQILDPPLLMDVDAPYLLIDVVVQIADQCGF